MTDNTCRVPDVNRAAGGPLCACAQPAARVSTVAFWFDGVNREVTNANYGTGSRAALPPTTTGGVLVNQTAFDAAGRPFQKTDPKNVVNQRGYDDANRTTQTVEDVGGLARTTNYTYTLDSAMATMTAINAATGNQTTTWTYGTTLAESGVARNDLVRYIDYPDSVSGSDRVAWSYNRQGEKLTITDQRGNVHSLYRDKLARQTNDCITTLGTATDGSVLQIATAYHIRGMANLITSFDSATQNSGTILNQVSMVYNDFAQLISEPQSHSGAVTSSTPAVGYAYDTGDFGSNEIRQNALIYPNGRIIANNFGTPGGINDLLNRVDTIQGTTAGITDLAAYTYIGMSNVVRIAYPEPRIWLDLWGGVSGQFAGLDQFGRIIDQRWQSCASTPPTDIDRYQYGYDPNSNPAWKANIVGTPNVAGGLDEIYQNDNLNRLTDMQRGILNAARTALTTTAARQMAWTLDPTGNWSAYVTQTSGSTDLNQGRASNPVNEITSVTASGGTPVWVTPGYDASGNMTTMPQPGTPTSAFTALYDAWSRMVKISAGSSTVGQYMYDGRSRRAVSTTPTETRHFYFTNNWQDVEQRVGTATTMDQQHAWGIRYIDEPICRDDATPRRLFATLDAMFTATSLAGNTGSPMQRFLYDPYGLRQTLTAAWGAGIDAYSWASGLTGQRWDLETSLNSNRLRIYNPATGTFSGRDPLGVPSGDSPNAYAGDLPLAVLDPWGTRSERRVPPAPPAPMHPQPAPAPPPPPPTTRPQSQPSTEPSTGCSGEGIERRTDGHGCISFVKDMPPEGCDGKDGWSHQRETVSSKARDKVRRDVCIKCENESCKTQCAVDQAFVYNKATETSGETLIVKYLCKCQA